MSASAADLVASNGDGGGDPFGVRFAVRPRRRNAASRSEFKY
jgi:hypothetical protein